MDIVLARKDFTRLGLIENANIIWTSRYYKTGDFQIIIPATDDNIALVNESYWVIRDDDEDNIGIIEDTTINNTSETGDQITIVGGLSPKVLFRRIISQQTQLYGNVQTNIRNLVLQNVINPTKQERKIACIELGELSEDITEKIEMQTTGDNLLTKIEEICETYSIGFRMPLRNGKLYFELYKGIDRSYNQNENPWVVFAEEYDNLIESEYYYLTSDLKNVFLIAGEGEGLDRKVLWGASKGNETTIKDLDRYEVYVDQRDLSSNEEDISNEEYTKQLNDEGKANLVSISQAFSGKIILNNVVYGKQKNGGDVFLGDIVTIKNWGVSINARIIETIESQDENGKVITLTFGI